MKLIIELNDERLDLAPDTRKNYVKREAARGVIYDDDGQIALQYVGKYDYYKLPGGGLEEGEEAETAFRREIAEEVGVKVKEIKSIGKTHEVHNKIARDQISYCFIAIVDGYKGNLAYDSQELEEEYQLLWVEPLEALERIETSEPKEYKGHIIIKRDAAILKEALKYES